MEPYKDKEGLNSNRVKISDILEQLVASIAEGYIAEFKDSATDARRRAELAISRIQAEAAGTAVYIAKGHLWFVGEKHRRIYRRFNGSNHAQLAREFDLTVRQIYAIVEMMRREKSEKQQLKLFGDNM